MDHDASPADHTPLAAAARKAALVAWIGLWLTIALVTFVRIRDLRSVTTALDQSAVALDTAGSGLETVGAVPIVGDGPARLGREVRSTAAEARDGAARTRATLDSVSILIAVAVLGATVTPAVVAYRLGQRIRELGATRAVPRAPAPAS